MGSLGVALFLAAAPNLFGADLLFRDTYFGYLAFGSTLWASAFLAAFAILAEVGSKDRVVNAWSADDDARSGFCTTALMVGLVSIGMPMLRYGGHIPPPSVFRAMILFGATFALGTIFWQGLLQGRLLAGLGHSTSARFLRIFIVSAVAALLQLSHLFTYESSLLALRIRDFFIIYLVVALFYEQGYAHKRCAEVAALLGAVYALANHFEFL